MMRIRLTEGRRYVIRFVIVIVAGEVQVAHWIIVIRCGEWRLLTVLMEVVVIRTECCRSRRWPLGSRLRWIIADQVYYVT